METQVIETPQGLSVVLPPEVAERYHLEAGVQLELVAEESGIFLRPVGVEPWFSVEWEQALDAVMERHGRALEAMHE